jgi:hypothetical protein
MAIDIEKKISLSHKADAERLPVFRFGLTTILTPALKIKYPEKIRIIQPVNICFYKREHVHRIACYFIVPGRAASQN